MYINPKKKVGGGLTPAFTHEQLRLASKAWLHRLVVQQTGHRQRLEAPLISFRLLWLIFGYGLETDMSAPPWKD